MPCCQQKPQTTSGNKSKCPDKKKKNFGYKELQTPCYVEGEIICKETPIPPPPTHLVVRNFRNSGSLSQIVEPGYELDRKPLYQYMNVIEAIGGVSNAVLKFNTIRIFAFASGAASTITVGIYKLDTDGGAVFGDVSTYNNSAKIREGNISFDPGLGISKYLDISIPELILDTSGHYFIGVGNNVQGGPTIKSSSIDEENALQFLTYRDITEQSGLPANMGNNADSDRGASFFFLLYNI